jgi:hypothetical protein
MSPAPAPSATEAQKSDDSFGKSGLHLSDLGEDGGGRGEGICLCGDPSLRPGPLPAARFQVNGLLATNVVEGVVRANADRFRRCYEDKLREKPSLRGRITVKFVIDRTGAVSIAADGGSDVPDDTLVSCVIRSFSELKFPAPRSGIVTVVAPVTVGRP